MANNAMKLRKKKLNENPGSHNRYRCAAPGNGNSARDRIRMWDDTTVYVQKETLHITHEPGEEATVVIKVQTDYMTKRYPIVRYDIEKNTLTVNGKRCREAK